MNKVRIDKELRLDIELKIISYIEERFTKPKEQIEEICANVEKAAHAVALSMCSLSDLAILRKHKVVRHVQHVHLHKGIDASSDYGPEKSVKVNFKSPIYLPDNGKAVHDFGPNLFSNLGTNYVEYCVTTVNSYYREISTIKYSYFEILYSYRFLHTLLRDYPKFIRFVPDRYKSAQITVEKFENEETDRIAV